jgi:hypothetical protein
MATKYFDGDVSGDVTVAGNWDGNALPAANDDIVFDGDLIDSAVTTIVGNLTVTVSSVLNKPNCTQDFGADGTPLAWDIGGTGDKKVHDQGTGTKYLDFDNWVEWNILAGTAEIAGDTAAANTLYIGGATVTIGDLEADEITVDGGTVTIGEDLTENDGATAPNMIIHGGTVTCESPLGRVDQYSGILRQMAGVITALYVNGGATYINALDSGATGVITVAQVESGGKLDFSEDPRAKTVTACSVESGGTLHDPLGVVTWPNDFSTPHCGLNDCTIDVGRNRKYAVADI